jgi:hypothetical protein
MCIFAEKIYIYHAREEIHPKAAEDAALRCW